MEAKISTARPSEPDVHVEDVKDLAGGFYQADDLAADGHGDSPDRRHRQLHGQLGREGTGLLVNYYRHGLTPHTLIFPIRRKRSATDKLFSQTGRERPWMLALLLAEAPYIAMDDLPLVIRKCPSSLDSAIPALAFPFLVVVALVVFAPVPSILLSSGRGNRGGQSRRADQTHDKRGFHKFYLKHNIGRTSLLLQSSAGAPPSQQRDYSAQGGRANTERCSTTQQQTRHDRPRL